MKNGSGETKINMTVISFSKNGTEIWRQPELTFESFRFELIAAQEQDNCLVQLRVRRTNLSLFIKFICPTSLYIPLDNFIACLHPFILEWTGKYTSGVGLRARDSFPGVLFQHHILECLKHWVDSSVSRKNRLAWKGKYLFSQNAHSFPFVVIWTFC